MTQEHLASEMSVLVVDDHHISREFTARALSDAGFRVAEATGARRAVPIALADRPAWVLLDWRLGDGNGGEVARAIRRAWPDGWPVPGFILLTGEAPCAVDDEARAKGIEEDFDGVLLKPFRVAELLEKIMPAAPTGVQEGKPRPTTGLVRSITTELLRALPVMEQALLSGQLPRVAGQTHRLIASSALSGANELEQALRQLERSCHAPADAGRVANCWAGVTEAAGLFLVATP